MSRIIRIAGKPNDVVAATEKLIDFYGGTTTMEQLETIIRKDK